MKLRRDFYSKHPDQLPQSPLDRGEITEQFIYSSDETICLSLEYADNDVPCKEEEEEVGEDNTTHSKRFLRCPAAVTVGLLKRLIRGKYGLDCNHALDVLYGDSFLCDEYSLVDLAYIYNWRRKGPMRLRYRIYQRLEKSSTLTNGTNGTEEVRREIKEEEKKEEVKEPTKEVQLEISESGVMSVSSVDTRNGEIEENCSAVLPTATETTTHTEKQPNSPKLESNLVPETQDTVSKTDTNKDDSSHSKELDDIKTKVSLNTNAHTSVVDTTTTTDTVVDSTTSNAVIPTRTETTGTTTSSSHKTLKPPPTSWNQNVNRVGVKRVSSVAIATNDNSNPDQAVPPPAKRLTPSSPSKAPRFFKVRNSSQSNSTDNSTVNCKPIGTSIASVTESPVQEVAVNLTKVPISPKKPADKEKSSKEGRVASPRPTIDSGLINPIRPYSVPVPSQSKRQPSPNLAAEDAAARLRHILNPISSSASPATSSTSNDSSVQHLRFPSTAAAAWLNLARGVPNRPAPLTLGTGSPFNSRPPLSPAHFISSFIASHPHYPYLSPMGLPPPPENKKSLPASTSSPSLPVSHQSHKSISPRTSTSFPTPTFNLNTLQQCGYPPSLSPLLPSLPRELVGSFYHSSYVPRPFMTGRGTLGSPLSVSPKSLSSSSSPNSSSSGGGFHPSLPPTVTSVSSNNSLSAVGKKSSGLRPIVPRRTVAPPPPLVPIGTTPGPAVRSPPTLLPIKDVVDKEQTSAKASPTPTASNCVKVVESCVVRPTEDTKSGSVPESTTSTKESADSRIESQESAPKENGKLSAEMDNNKKVETPSTPPPLECSKKKTEANNVKELEKSESKVEVAATSAL